jgi:predicted outer membrane repeat protein
VLFTAPASGASGTFADTGIPLTTAITDERGVASAATLTANALRGSYAVTATVTGSALTSTYQLVNIAWYVAPGGNDNSDCLTPATACATINGALQQPNQSLASGDTIRVAVGVYTEAVNLNHGLTLSGGWNDTFTARIGMSTVDGGGERAGVHVAPRLPRIMEFPAVIERFTIQNARESTFGEHGIGNNSILTLRHCVVSHNVASAVGGGIYNQDGATLTIIDSTISDNVSGLWGGGIYNDGVLVLDHSTVARNRTTAPNPGNGEGGGIYNRQALTVIDSSISGNEANTGGGIYTNLISIGETTIVGSAVVGNLAQRQGGGVFARDGSVNLDNSTIDGNVSGDKGGGLYKTEDPYSLKKLSLNNVTVSNNRAAEGGGIYAEESVALRNSIVAGNEAPAAPDCLGTINSGGYNLIGKQTGECALTSAPGDLLGVSARLGPLMGSPAYHPLSRGSPAIDAGNPFGCADWNGDPLTTDQRGAPRPVDGNRDGTPGCDIGAYEYDSGSDPLSYTFVPMMLR